MEKHVDNMNEAEFKSIDPKQITQSAMHHLLLNAVAPRPICFASTVDRKGSVNLSPFSFFNAFSSQPPILVFAPVRRGRDGTNKDTYDNILEVKETVINIVNYQIAEQMSLASTEYDKGVNEFVKAGFTELKSDVVRPPRVKEAPISFECVVDNVIDLGEGPGSGSLIVSRVVMMHVRTSYLIENERLDSRNLDLIGRMGGGWYVRAANDALFEIPKPLRTKGIGIDRLPDSIKNSPVLTGNNLGRLGNMENLPNEKDIRSIRENPAIIHCFEEFSSKPVELSRAIHNVAKEWTESGKVEDALSAMMLLDLNQ